MVSKLEYPINGGNDTIKIRTQSISHPAVTSLHFFATGNRAPNMRSLYTKNSMPPTANTKFPTKNSTFCRGDSLLYWSRTRRESVSYLSVARCRHELC